ncbi:MAG TPA: lactonase family protein [Acholeplasma sp.]|nr:lactonase family protein [Acholeplasma sp.]
MKVLIGSYKENIYEVEIDNKKDKIVSNNKIIDAVKPSYIMEFNNLSYLYLKDNVQYIKIGDEDLLLTHPAAHISHDNANNVIYVSFYHDGLLKVLSKKNNKWEISETLQYKDNSHIHYAEFIEDINLVGVCDLGDDKFFLYEYSNEHLNLVANYEFEEGVGPRHFVANGNLIYVINELKPSVSILKYKNSSLELVDNIELVDGAGSAIRMTKDKKYLYAAVRFSNYLYAFEVKENGLLNVIQKVHTKGDHPRDFNLIYDDKYLLVANMNSNNLSLFKLNNGRLYLTDHNYQFNAGASIICIK